MKSQNLEAFFHLVSRDEKLQHELSAAEDAEAFVRAVVRLGREKGCSFSQEQVESALSDARVKRAAKHRERLDELSDEQLEAVAGAVASATFGQKVCLFGDDIDTSDCPSFYCTQYSAACFTSKCDLTGGNGD